MSKETKKDIESWGNYDLLVSICKKVLPKYIDGSITAEETMRLFGAKETHPHCEDCVYNRGCIPFCHYLWKRKLKNVQGFSKAYLIPRDVYCGTRSCRHFIPGLNPITGNELFDSLDISEKGKLGMAVQAGNAYAAYLYMTYYIENDDDAKFAEICYSCLPNEELAYKVSQQCERLHLYEKRTQWLLRAALDGCANAAFDLGVLYAEGIGVEQDWDKAVYWYEVACKGKDDFAWCNLGRLYLSGTGVPKDEKKGYRLIKKAAEAGNEVALNNLGYLYMNGIGTRKNQKKAFSNYTKAAELGDVPALNNLGHCYSSGVGCEVNHEKAVECFLKAIKGGDVTYAPCNLGEEYMKIKGVGVDYQKAWKYFRLSSRNGHARAYHMMGFLMMNGLGTDANPKKAIQYLRKSIKGGCVAASAELALCYENGDGVPENLKKALQLMESVYPRYASIRERIYKKLEKKWDAFVQDKKKKAWPDDYQISEEEIYGFLVSIKDKPYVQQKKACFRLFDKCGNNEKAAAIFELMEEQAYSSEFDDCFPELFGRFPNIHAIWRVRNENIRNAIFGWPRVYAL